MKKRYGLRLKIKSNVAIVFEKGYVSERVSFEGCRNEARGTIDKFECSPAPPSNLQLFSVAGKARHRDATP